MSAKEREEFLAWNEGQRSEVFDNINVLEDFCRDDVTVLRQACRVFRREFIEIGNVDVFLEAITIVSAFNKVLRKRFLKPNTIGLIPTGWYSCNVNHSKKALMWLVRKERTDGLVFHTVAMGENSDCQNYPPVCGRLLSRNEQGVRVQRQLLAWHTCLQSRDFAILNGVTLRAMNKQWQDSKG